ncbi:MAG: sulfotransferase [Geminicoccaceae bacterium]|jgi:hypothetical protein|nr:sulfotransferase [Geminicoccaceae bacterium]HRX72877.1 sulfotransferase [Hyphomonas sp.]
MRKLFLVGSPRSGTTLLQTILTSQLELFTLKETHFFRHLHRWRPVRWLDRLQLDRARVDAAFRFITENNALEGSYDWAGVRRLADACRLFDRLMTRETSLRDRRGWLEKSPEHMFFIDEIRRHLPTARFVHILRDGPDVVASLHDARTRYPDHWSWLGDLDQMIDLYNRYCRVIRKNIGRPDTFVVRYADLVENDTAVLDALAHFLDLDPGALSVERIASYRTDIVRPEEAWKIRDEKQIVDTRGQKFNSLFSVDEQKRILRRLVPVGDLASG